jgi:hypothetical protein
MRRIDNFPSQEPTSKGWLLYIGFAIAAGLLYLERRSSMTSTDHTIALTAIVLAFFVLTVLWISGEGGI